MIYPAPASACICVHPKNPLKQSSAAFSGTVIDVKDRHTYEDRYEVTIEVDQVFKGSVSDQVKVITDDDSMWCGQRFVEGSDYLIYAQKTYHEGYVYKTNNCYTKEMPLALLPILGLTLIKWVGIIVMVVSVILYVKLTSKK